MYSETIEIDGKTINYERMGEGAHHILIIPTKFGVKTAEISPKVLNKTFGPLFDSKLLTVIALNPFEYEFPKHQENISDKDVYKSDCDYAAKLMTRIGINNYSIMGCAEGAKIALQMAIKYPSKVSKLIIWNANAYAIDADKYGAIETSDKRFFNFEVNKISCETLILHGDMNSLPMMHSTFFLENIPKSKLYRFPHGSQHIHTEFPKVFCEVVVRFLLK